MATPAQAILASTLFEAAVKTGKTSVRTSTSCIVIDDALRGGFDHGRISCISGDLNTGKTTICMNAVVSHLVSASESHVAVIDAAGTFNVLRLYETLRNRISPLRTTSQPLEPGERSQVAPENAAERMLEKVKIIRAFDFVGVLEAFNEIRDDPGVRETVPAATHIDDSQADDEEMLLDWPQSPERQNRTTENLRSWLLVFVGFGQTVNTLFKKDFIQGQAILTSFLYTLSLYTADTKSCVILTNPAYSPKTSPPSIETPTQFSGAFISDLSKQSSVADHPSIFASNQTRPSLAKALAPFLDFHVLVSLLPKSKQDAQSLYGKSSAHRSGKPELVNVVEVITDRWSDRVGRWAAFQVADSGALVSLS